MLQAMPASHAATLTGRDRVAGSGSGHKRDLCGQTLLTSRSTKSFRAYPVPPAFACRIPVDCLSDSAAGSGGLRLCRQSLCDQRHGKYGWHDGVLPRHGGKGGHRGSARWLVLGALSAWLQVSGPRESPYSRVPTGTGQLGRAGAIARICHPEGGGGRCRPAWATSPLADSELLFPHVASEATPAVVP